VNFTDQQLLIAFESCQMSHQEWTHEAHLRVAYLYCKECELELAIDKMTSGLKALNAAHGVVDAPERGYHETITQAFMRLVAQNLRLSSVASDSMLFIEQHPELKNRRVLLCYYTRDRIMSPEAKVTFLEPDLAPFTQTGLVHNDCAS
tara:strand:- start:562 stop:1005 length:444 start_codon:yes stop_codon:yes gene_type:complete